MEEKVSTSKIIVDESNEITDLVRKIHGSKADRLVLTFTEQTDILISPINLTLLQETAEKEAKLLIAQIIQNPTGIRNAKIAGIKTIDTPSNPTELDWEDALEVVKEGRIKRRERRETLIREDVQEKEAPSFEKRVDTSLEKPTEKGYVDRRGIKTSSFISIDEDLPPTGQISKDISSQQVPPLGGVAEKPKVKKKISFSFLNKFKSIGKKKFLKISLLILAPLLFLAVLAFVLYNQFATFARVRIFVESKPVQIEVILDGKEKIEDIGFEELEIPIKTEQESKSLSDSINATGKAEKGEKATGVIQVTYLYGEGCNSDVPPLKLEPGHVIKTSQYSYKVVSGEQVPCNLFRDYQVVAAEIGDEYNITSGKSFTVEGFPSDKVFGLNSSSFTGGTKQEYTVLSQTDVDNAVEQLSLTAIEEVKSALREVDNNWDIIEDSIKSEVDKSSIKTDKQVGAEATVVNLDLTIKGTATYYSSSGLSEGLTDLLRSEAEKQNLFDSEKDLDLVLGDSVEMTVSVESAAAGGIKIKIEASSNVKPKVDKDQLQEMLKGMKWQEGVEYINNLKYAKKDAEIVFNPESFPSFLKRFPKRRGGVLVTVVELKVEE